MTQIVREWYEIFVLWDEMDFETLVEVLLIEQLRDFLNIAKTALNDFL